ncbi:hypothetical protein FCS83_07280 [Oenococcus sp. UCMA 17063]|nr:hypothetical protein [Oenococcus sp. UCMA 17063]
METKVRKVGNALGVVFSKKLALKEGQVYAVKQVAHGLLLEEIPSDQQIQAERAKIETGFNDFKNGRYHSLESYAKELGIKL